MDSMLTVLYAEDEQDIREIIDFTLEDEGFELLICTSGQEAIDKAAGVKPDLFLLDVMMPGIDGPTTLNRLREFPHLAETPAIFMTAKVQTSEIEEYMALSGVVGVISKPFDPMTLADQIRALLSAK